MYNYSFIEVSSNRKTGKMPTTSTSQNSCPDSCQLKAKGCYAKSGPVFWQWKKLDGKGLDIEQLAHKLQALPVGTIWRHNVAGDLPSNAKGTIKEAFLIPLVNANKRRKLKGFTYTHNKLTPKNISILESANKQGFTINASCDNINQALKVKKATSLPVVVILPLDAPNVQNMGGVDIVACPAEKSDKVTCLSCKMCANSERDYIIGFRAHGTGKKSVDIIARG